MGEESHKIALDEIKILEISLILSLFRFISPYLLRVLLLKILERFIHQPHFFWASQ